MNDHHDKESLSPVLDDCRDKMRHFEKQFTLSEVACNETAGMQDWWNKVDLALAEGKRIRLVIVEVD